jgi:hypothetical protein
MNILIRAPEATNKPADRKRDRDGRIGPGFDVFPDRLLKASRLSPDDRGRVASGFAGLSIQVLGCACRLFQRPFDLALDVSGCPSEASCCFWLASP